MEKNNKLLVSLVIVLCVLVICLFGYIIYDKNTSINASSNTPTEQKEDNKTDISNNNENNDEKECPICEKCQTCDNNVVKTNDINENEKVKIHYYVSKGSSHKYGYRFSLTLLEPYENGGIFILAAIGGNWEAPSYVGFYDIKDGKINLTNGPYINTDTLGDTEYVNKLIGITFETSSDYKENYKGYTTNYSENTIMLGNIALEKVN